MNKYLDLCRYYSRVEHYCCYNKRYTGSSEFKEMISPLIDFEEVLEVKYRISPSWDNWDREKVFYDIYKQYRDWLVRKYLDRFVFFSGRYENCFSVFHKKDWDIKSFQKVYGGGAKNALFLAQTFADFAVNENILKTEENNQSITAHKMYLASLCMLKLIGYRQYDGIIQYEKNLIDSMITK